jgi:pimeloyl-ACP methyl ester carboxylesterase
VSCAWRSASSPPGSAGADGSTDGGWSAGRGAGRLGRAAGGVSGRLLMPVPLPAPAVPQTGAVKPVRLVLPVLALLASGCSSSATSEPSAAATPAVSSTAPAPASSAAPLAWQACEPGFECATLPVPLVEGDPDQGTVELALTRRPATGPEARVGSLVVNPGGPGASAVEYLQAAWEQIPEPVRERFDLVAFDPRGVGRSEPVRCATTAELDSYFHLDPEPDDTAELSALEAGTEQLVAGCAERSGDLLPHVSTADAARDLDRVRAAVGDERLTYLGYSYGTSLGAAYLERFPTNVRAMVLDGGIDPTLTWDQLLEGQSSGFDRALEAFLADCQQTRCAFRQAVGGDLGQAFDALAARVERQPLRGDGERTVGPGEFSLGVGAALYSRANGWPALAAGLAQAQNGDGSTLLALSDSYLDRGPDGYANVSEANLAVNCLDRPWPEDTESYLRLAERVGRDSPRFGPAIALSGLACADWPVEPVAEPHRIVAEGAPPVVVIGTTGDPATPYAWSKALAEQLASGVLLTYRGDGHTVYRAGAPACLVEPVNDYLITGKAPEPLSC